MIAPDCFEQRVIHHVACAKLEHISMFRDCLNKLWLHDFSDDRQTRLLTRFRKQAQPFNAEPLELVRGGAWFEGPTAQDLGTSFLHRARCCQDVLTILDRTWARHDDRRS